MAVGHQVDFAGAVSLGKIRYFQPQRFQTAGLFTDAPLDEMEWPDAAFGFLRWGADGASMLLRYNCVDTGGMGHMGYFWYNCKTGKVSGQIVLVSEIYLPAQDFVCCR